MVNKDEYNNNNVTERLAFRSVFVLFCSILIHRFNVVLLHDGFQLCLGGGLMAIAQLNFLKPLRIIDSESQKVITAFTSCHYIVLHHCCYRYNPLLGKL